MCQFISLAASQQPPDLLSEANGRPVARAFSPRTPSVLLPHLRSGEAAYWSGSHCDCGTALGAAPRVDDGRSAFLSELDKQATKLRRKGWSETKIARWKEEKSSTKNAAEPNQRELIHWSTLLHQIVTRKHSAGLFLASEDQGSEDASVSTESIDVSAVTPDWLSHIEQNVLYRIHSV